MALNTSATDRAFIVGLGVDTEAVNGNIQSYFYKTLVTALYGNDKQFREDQCLPLAAGVFAGAE
jgi:hypothetical protein